MTFAPVAELTKLREKEFSTRLTLNDGDANPLAKFKGELVEVRATFEPESNSEVSFSIRGIPIIFNATKQELTVNGHRSPAPLRAGKQQIRILADRTVFEVFASDGLTYVPLPVIPKADARDIAVSVKGGAVKFSSLEANQLESIWK